MQNWKTRCSILQLLTNYLTFIFYSSLEHLNYLGIDDRFGPVALSLKREKLDESTSLLKSGESEGNQYQYRIIIRTSEVCVFKEW